MSTDHDFRTYFPKSTIEKVLRHAHALREYADWAARTGDSEPDIEKAAVSHEAASNLRRKADESWHCARQMLTTHPDLGMTIVLAPHKINVPAPPYEGMFPGLVCDDDTGQPYTYSLHS